MWRYAGSLDVRCVRTCVCNPAALKAAEELHARSKGYLTSVHGYKVVPNKLSLFARARALPLSHTVGSLFRARGGRKGEGCGGTSEYQTLCEVKPPQTVWFGHCVRYSPRKVAAATLQTPVQYITRPVIPSPPAPRRLTILESARERQREKVYG